MVKILAIDTATEACSVALYADGSVSEDFVVLPREHTRKILPMVAGILAVHQISLQQLDAIAFSCGPGSFTGLRIASGIVQGLALGAELPVIPISTLAAMAHGVYYENPHYQTESNIVISALDAKMSEVYWGVYGLDANGDCVALQDDRVCAPKDADITTESQSSASGIIGVGSGWHLQHQFHQMPETIALLHIDKDFMPHARDVAWLSYRAFQQGQMVTAENALPVYLRNTVSWKKRTRLRSS